MSVLHYRILEALDTMACALPAAAVPAILQSLPMDKDRALLYENDGYEILVARTVERSGQAPDVVEACLAALGETGFDPGSDLAHSVTTSPHAQAHIRKHTAEARAAQVLSVVCRDRAYAAKIRERLSAFLRKEPSETRSWVCFMLIRTLAKLRDSHAADLLMNVLEQEPTEVAGGTNPPPTHWVHKAMKPFFRAVAAYGLGEIGDHSAVPILLGALEDFDNAPAVRHQATLALGKLRGGSHAADMRRIALDYPDLRIQRALLEAVGRASRTKAGSP